MSVNRHSELTNMIFGINGVIVLDSGSLAGEPSVTVVLVGRKGTKNSVPIQNETEITAGRDDPRRWHTCGLKDGNQHFEYELSVYEECDTVVNADVNGGGNI
jgi:hypothetical protein